MRYYWISFSKFVEQGYDGNLGAVLLSSERELDREEIIAELQERDLIPDQTMSMYGGEMEEEDALKFPLNQFMTTEELRKRDDVVETREDAGICEDCAREHGII